jgi:hypothetical protein
VFEPGTISPRQAFCFGYSHRMSTPHIPRLALAALMVCATASFAAATEQYDQDRGKPAPELISAGWVGTPVTLSAVHGNTVVLAFWNADIPC